MNRRLGAATVAASLLLTLTACGGGDGDTTTDGAGSDTTSESDAPADEPADEPADAGDDTGDDAPAEAPAGGVTYVDITDSPAATVTVSDGAFEPGDISVAVGDVVEFTAPEGLYSVIAGDLDGYTVGSSIDAYFQFDEPGTYPITEDLYGGTATVTVE